MGQRVLLVSGLISYSLAWPERWPGEGDEPLLAQHLGNLVAISFCLFFPWRIATPLCLSPRPVAGWATCRCAQSHRASTTARRPRGRRSRATTLIPSTCTIQARVQGRVLACPKDTTGPRCTPVLLGTILAEALRGQECRRAPPCRAFPRGTWARRTRLECPCRGSRVGHPSPHPGWEDPTIPPECRDTW